MRSKTSRRTWSASLALAAFAASWLGALEHSLHAFEAAGTDPGAPAHALYCGGCDSSGHPHPWKNSHDERTCRVCTARSVLNLPLERGTAPELAFSQPVRPRDEAPDGRTFRHPHHPRGPPRFTP